MAKSTVKSTAKKTPAKKTQDQGQKKGKKDLMDVCLEAPNPEMARNSAEDDPCDEGTSGKRI